MKKNILISLCLVLGNLLAQPAFKFASESYDFGEIPEGPQAIYSFEFTNVGDKPLVISHAQASCGCTVPEWSKDTIKPGAKGFVKAIYNTAGRLGPFTKSITINYNNEADPSKVLYIRGTVVKAEDKPVYTKEQLDASPIISLDKTSYSFGKVERGQKVTHKFTVKNIGKGVLKISELNSVCNCITAESKPEVKAGQSATLKITYNPTGINDVTDILTIKSNDITKEPVKLTLKAVVVESLNKKTILNEGSDAVPFGK